MLYNTALISMYRIELYITSNLSFETFIYHAIHSGYLNQHFLLLKNASISDTDKQDVAPI